MKVITIKQPFATLIAKGYKEYEFRTWITKYRGDILIHAGKGIDKEAMKRYEYLNLDYPSGCIIAKAKLTDCLIVDNDLKSILRNSKDSKIYYGVLNKEYDGYAFKLENVEEISPIYINGKLSLWNYDVEKL
jgi:hypothetical protein